jgi:prepilin-type N-terminal cleavage/methylation domain-containing protein
MNPLSPSRANSPSGYTLLELIIIVVIVGVLSAIAVPSYLSWANNQRTSAVQGQIVDVLRKAQSEAKQRKNSREIRFDNNNGAPRYAIVPVANDALGQPVRVTNAAITNWQSLNPDANLRTLQLNLLGNPYSPFPGPSDSPTSGGIIFDSYGAVVAAYPANFPGSTTAIFAVQVSINSGNQQGHRRCVIIRTLLGALQEARDNACNLNTNQL